MASEQILVVEDNPTNMRLTRDILEGLGYSVLAAENAYLGIALAKGKNPALILMDLSLPGLDGLAATALLKQDAGTRHIPVVALTAHAMERDRESARAAGCSGFISKPIDLKSFRQTVTEFVRPTPAKSSTPPCHRVLVVDDDPLNRQLMVAMLTALGWESEVCGDGVEALARLHPGIDLVLLDVMMPGMDGFQVAQRIRATTDCRDVPILMVTALSGKEERLRAVEAGANDFIAKPVDYTELRIRATSLLKMKTAQDAVKQQHAGLEALVTQRTAALQLALDETVRAQELAHECQLETIQRLAVAAEFKDKDSLVHLRRVSWFSVLLARRLGLPNDEVECLRHASTLHDVGKLAIAESILVKPGKLDPEEWQQMQQHSRIGAQMLAGSRSRFLQVGEVIALTHHEKWDGSGYPQGLAREAIPLFGRICAVADVFDALTSARPYKDAFHVQAACEILREGKGSHFDPRLVDLFLADFDEVLQIREQAAFQDAGGNDPAVPSR
jgi:putative two-component system response regulator